MLVLSGTFLVALRQFFLHDGALFVPVSRRGEDRHVGLQEPDEGVVGDRLQLLQQNLIFRVELFKRSTLEALIFEATAFSQ